ncbi:MAG: hypothetical protein ACXADB_10550 [Candidatus Hermodarchaeia archaeon]
MSGLKEAWIGRGFSIEMESKRHVKNISISDEAHDRVLFEGNIGELEELSMVDERVLEIRGSNGLLRVDVTVGELDKMISDLRSKNA